ncbi:uncharacterized protein LOC120147520 [Hibiscus syriacus]|uniref:uncharacterized protein LOC120147520 n=1 Tax=Hibiscus syriacus TaxID=106335 RepID=UPI00192206D7|nr:uncharacterized protein LOC120147520 [Hibiscus syriacus]
MSKGENTLASKSNLERTSVANFESSVDAFASRFNSYGSYSPARADMRRNGCEDLPQKAREMVANKGTMFRRDESMEDASSGSQASAAADGNLGTNDGKSDRLLNVKSVRASSDLARSNGELKEVGVVTDAHHGPGSFRSKLSNERKVSKVYPKDTRSAVLDNKVQRLENRIKMLEGELREAAALKAALYSVVAEDGSSMSKVHAPARRPCRLYLHSCKEGSQLRRASAAIGAVSGLVLVAKACGNDVPRLTFWLSNCVVVRAIISENIGEFKLPLCAGPMERNGGGKGKKQASSPLKWKESSPGRKENKTSSDRDNHLSLFRP